MRGSVVIVQLSFFRLMLLTHFIVINLPMARIFVIFMKLSWYRIEECFQFFRIACLVLYFLSLFHMNLKVCLVAVKYFINCAPAREEGNVMGVGHMNG